MRDDDLAHTCKCLGEINRMTEDIQISAETTPNPNTLKFVVNRQLLKSGGVDFPDKEKAKGSPLAVKLFEVASVRGVFVGTNFITVTKSEDIPWKDLALNVTDLIRESLQSGLHVDEEIIHEQKDMDPIERKVRDILDREIRPAVAMDGGDILFKRYIDGVVTLHLRGSCSSCPSSVMTLKMGVENRLRSVIPEIKEVIQE
jgi:NFU1 iron-sulfur cluster scaffold homolog, mitochondrial